MKIAKQLKKEERKLTKLTNYPNAAYYIRARLIQPRIKKTIEKQKNLNPGKTS